MTFVVGPVEELCKFAAVRLGPYRSLYFDEPVDGLVYASAASLGFASLENLFYVLEYGPEVMIAPPLSTVGHLVFVWGFALGQYCFKRKGAFVLVRFSRFGGGRTRFVQRSRLFSSPGRGSAYGLRRSAKVMKAGSPAKCGMARNIYL